MRGMTRDLKNKGHGVRLSGLVEQKTKHCSRVLSHPNSLGAGWH